MKHKKVQEISYRDLTFTKKLLNLKLLESFYLNRYDNVEYFFKYRPEGTQFYCFYSFNDDIDELMFFSK